MAPRSYRRALQLGTYLCETGQLLLKYPQGRLPGGVLSQDLTADRSLAALVRLLARPETSPPFRSVW